MIRWRATLLLVLGLLAAGVSNAAVPTSTKLTLELTPAGIDTRWPTNAAWILATEGLNFATIPDCVVANGATGSCNIRAPYLTDVVGGATLAANCSSALPTGGFSLTTDGVDYASTTTTDITCTFTATRSPFVAISNSVRIASAGTPSADSYAPTIPIDLTCTSGTTGQIPCTVSPPRDPRTGTSWSGIDHLQYSVGGVATATIAALPGSQYTFTDTQIGVDPASTTFTGTDPDVVIGAGGDVDATTDIVAFRNTPVTGDFVATIKVNGITSTSNYNKCGLMIRETLNDNSAMLVGHVQKSAAAPLDVQLRGRASTAANVGGLYGATISAVPYWIRLARVGNVFTEYGSSDGNAFTSLSTANYSIASTVYVGPYGVGSGATEVVCDTSNFTLTQDPVLSFAYNDASATPSARSIAVRAYDVAGNVSSYGTAVSATAGAISDVTAPSTPANPTANANGSQTQINFSADAATDAGGVRGYVWAFSATLGGTYTDVAEQAGVAYTLTGLTGSTTRYGKVKAVDNAGNVGSYSTTANATTAASPTAPDAPPTSVTAVPSPANPTINMLITWVAPATGSCDHYVLRHHQAAADPYYVDPTVITGLSYTSTGNGVQTFSPNTSYLFSVGCSDATRQNIFWSADVTGTTSTTTSNAINWHPGHYAIPTGYIFPGVNIAQRWSQYQTVLSEVAANSNWKGIEIYFYWGTYEGATAGDYTAGRAMIQQYLDWAAAHNKYVIFNTIFGHYSGTTCSIVLPAYIVNGANYGCTLGNNGRTTYARMWQQPTMDRYIAMMQDIGTQFGNHPNFEMVWLWEESVAVNSGVDGYSRAALVTQYQRWMTATRAAMPKQQVRLGMSWTSTTDGSDVASLLNTCLSTSCTLGGPDATSTTLFPANNIYAGLTLDSSGGWTKAATDYRGVMPFVSNIESGDLNSAAVTLQTIYDVANSGGTTSGGSTIRATRPSYFSWSTYIENTDSTKQWETGIRPFVEGGTHPILYTTCPSSFPSCKTN